jgi:hypothetical protein
MVALLLVAFEVGHRINAERGACCIVSSAASKLKLERDHGRKGQIQDDRRVSFLVGMPAPH